MPFLIGTKRGGRVLAATLGLAALIATPAHAAGAIANPYNCTPQPTLQQFFFGWNDTSLYTPVANAGVEQGSTGWTLTGSAAVVAGNEPWNIGGPSDRSSLNLPAGSSAVTAPICIDETYPHFRLFVRNTGALNTSLKIEVLYFDTKGKLISTKPYDYKTQSTAWEASGLVGINVFSSKKTTVAAAPVTFRFTPTGSGARYQIDDVYVDPWARS
jgi:hypothetical protein